MPGAGTPWVAHSALGPGGPWSETAQNCVQYQLSQVTDFWRQGRPAMFQLASRSDGQAQLSLTFQLPSPSEIIPPPTPSFPTPTILRQQQEREQQLLEQQVREHQMREHLQRGFHMREHHRETHNVRERCVGASLASSPSPGHSRLVERLLARGKLPGMTWGDCNRLVLQLRAGRGNLSRLPMDMIEVEVRRLASWPAGQGGGVPSVPGPHGWRRLVPGQA